MITKRTSIMIVAFVLAFSILAMPLANFVPKAEGAPPEKVIQWNFYVFSAPGAYNEFNTKRTPELVTRYTNGRVKLNLLIDVISPTQSLYAVRDKKAEGGIFPPVYYGGEWPLGEITNLPFFYYDLKEYEQVHKDFVRGVLVSGFSERYKCVLLTSSSWGKRGIFTRKPIATLKDFKGLKIRTATGMEAQALEAVDAVGVSLPAAEIYAAVERGIVDGVVIAPSYGIGFGLPEITKYFNLMPLSPLSAWVSVVNKSAFDALPEDLKPSIVKAFKEIEDTYWSAEDKDGDEAIKKIEGKGLQIVRPNRADIDKDIVPLVEKVWEGWVKRCEEKGIPGRDILNRTKAILQKIRGK